MHISKTLTTIGKSSHEEHSTNQRTIIHHFLTKTKHSQSNPWEAEKCVENAFRTTKVRSAVYLPTSSYCGFPKRPGKNGKPFLITYLRLVSGVGDSWISCFPLERWYLVANANEYNSMAGSMPLRDQSLSSKRMIFCGWTKLAVSNFQHQSGDTSAISKPLPEKKFVKKEGLKLKSQFSFSTKDNFLEVQQPFFIAWFAKHHFFKYRFIYHPKGVSPPFFKMVAISAEIPI